MSVEKIKLKPCPFCGGDVEFADYGQMGEFEDWAVYCKSCGIAMLAPGPEEGCIANREEAAKAWNRRAVPKTTQILADVLDGTPLLYPCAELWSPGGWCKDHCKPEQQEPDAECWLKYADSIGMKSYCVMEVDSIYEKNRENM